MYIFTLAVNLMKVLIVCSGNFPHFSFEKNQAFIYDQVEALRRQRPEISFSTFFVKKKGPVGYLASLKQIKKKIRTQGIDLIHAHGGHIGLLCGLQRIAPVVVSFHGSDINFKNARFFSAFAALLAMHSIFVSRTLANKALVKGKHSVIPCGVDFDTFFPTDSSPALKGKYILFASHFSNPIKNYPLAQKALEGIPVEIREIKNRSRGEVNLLLNKARLLLLTSFSEGSPQIIKEAMACNLPIVSTHVGDIKEVAGETEGCYICSSDPADVAEKINLALAFGKRTRGREHIKHLDNAIIAQRIYKVYQSV